MMGSAENRHLCDSVLLSNTWLFHMRVGCRAVQTRLSWITPRWEAVCTGLLTTILRRQVQDGVGVVAVVWHIQMDVISCQNIALCSTLFHFLCDCSSFEIACLAPCSCCSLIADHEDETSHSSLWLELWRLLCMSFAPIWVCDLDRFGIFGKPGVVR